MRRLRAALLRLASTVSARIGGSAPQEFDDELASHLAMHIEDIEYDAEGGRMVGHLCYDDEIAGARPSVLVCHGGAGLDDHVKRDVARVPPLIGSP